MNSIGGVLSKKGNPFELLQGILDFHFWPKTLEGQNEQADLKSQQSNQHSTLTESRLLNIEEKLSKILYESTEHGKQRKELPTPSIKELDWREFVKSVDTDSKLRSTNWKHAPEPGSFPRYVIEILMEEPNLDVSQPQTRSLQSITEYEQIYQTAISVNYNKSWGPHRVRLRSPILMKVLKEITGLRTVIGPFEHSLVFLKPFKLFFTHAKDIRSYLERLQRKSYGERPGICVL